jgi:hypothetical protein
LIRFGRAADNCPIQPILASTNIGMPAVERRRRLMQRRQED